VEIRAQKEKKHDFDSVSPISIIAPKPPRCC